MYVKSYEQFLYQRAQRRQETLRRINISIVQLARASIAYTEATLGDSVTYWLATYGGGLCTDHHASTNTQTDKSRRLNWLHVNPNSAVITLYDQQAQLTAGEWAGVDDPRSLARLRGIGDVHYPNLPYRPSVEAELEVAENVLQIVRAISITSD